MVSRRPQVGRAPGLRVEVGRRMVDPVLKKSCGGLGLWKSGEIRWSASEKRFGEDYTVAQGLPWWLSHRESTCQCWRSGFELWVGKITAEGNGNPLQYSHLGNPMDRGAWWAAVHGVAKGQIQLSDQITTEWPKETSMMFGHMECPFLSPFHGAFRKQPLLAVMYVNIMRDKCF